MNRFVRYGLIVVLMGSLTSCSLWRESPGSDETPGITSNFWTYLKTKILPGEPEKHIGYETMALRDGVPPEAVIDFDANSWTLDDSAYAYLDAIVSGDRRYLIEGTAGGLTNTALTLSRKRRLAVINYLEAQGVDPSRIFVVPYDPDKRGRQVRVYTITQ